MNPTRNQIIIIGIAVFAVIVLVLIFTGILPGLKPSQPKTGSGGISNGSQTTEINFWGVEDEGVIKPIIESYLTVNPNSRVFYTQFNESNYEKNLVDALASGKAPDIIMLHNNWLPKHYGKILPIPASSGFSITQIRQLFPTVVEQDFTNNGNIYALPIYIDTLAFIYNKDYFDAKGVAIVPKNWNEFQYVISRLKEVDSSGKIFKAAAAIGGSNKSIEKAPDLLSLIMLQMGVEMVDKNNSANFSKSEGENALNFYLQFSNPNSSNYTWHDNFRYSMEGFSQEIIGAIFNYAGSIKIIKEKNPFLNIEVAPMLQFPNRQSVNYANYWGLAVPAQSKNAISAWNFILYFSTNAKVAEQYLQASKRPPALRELIQKYSNDADLGVFARQALTARSWRQKDNSAIERIFSNMIESILSGRLLVGKAIEQAENEVNSL